MVRAWLSLGANIGDPPAQLAEAIRLLDAHPNIRVIKPQPFAILKKSGKIKEDRNPCIQPHSIFRKRNRKNRIKAEAIAHNVLRIGAARFCF